MVECIDKAYDKWDREMNRCYKELTRKLAADVIARLKDAQVQWLKFRDSELSLLDPVYARLDGTMYMPIRVGSRMAIVRSRALELKPHLELLKEFQ